MQAQHAHSAPSGSRGALIGGFVLVVIGVAALAAQYWPDAGRYVPLVIGLGLLALFAANRSYGALVGGSILTGLGAGVVAAQFVDNSSGNVEGAIVVLGLGLGFIAIWALAQLMSLKERHIWPLIPGMILVLVGSGLLLDLLSGDAARYFVPAAVIAVGLLVMLAGWLRMSRNDGSSPT
jgi:hypothetical protein